MAGLAVFHGITQGLLRNLVKLHHNFGGKNRRLRGSVKLQVDMKSAADVGGEFFQENPEIIAF